MKNLINGQSIRIDNHHRGDGSEFELKNNVHIHKVMNSDRYNGAEILIPLNETQDLIFKKIKGRDNIVKKQIVNEINKAFKDKRKRTEFVKYIFKRIEGFSNDTLSSNISNFIKGAKSLAKHFDLEEEIIKTTKNLIKDKIKSYTTLHKDKHGNKYYIIQDVNGKNIRIGADFDILNDWDTLTNIFKSN